MTADQIPLYLNWQFWAAIVAAAALVLSQLPPVVLWFRPRRLEVEVHSRIRVAHKVGNPNIGMVVSIRNTGGRELRIRSLVIRLKRDDKPLVDLSAQTFFENSSSTDAVLFVPFTLKPGEHWSHATNYLNFFDRATEKLYREAENQLRNDITSKVEAKGKEDANAVAAKPEYVEPFMRIFDQLFIWEHGEYTAELIVKAEPGSASFVSKYRFTLYESDTSALREYKEDYKYGCGIYYEVDKHMGVFVPISHLNS